MGKGRRNVDSACTPLLSLLSRSLTRSQLPAPVGAQGRVRQVAGLGKWPAKDYPPPHTTGNKVTHLHASRQPTASLLTRAAGTRDVLLLRHVVLRYALHTLGAAKAATQRRRRRSGRMTAEHRRRAARRYRRHAGVGGGYAHLRVALGPVGAAAAGVRVTPLGSLTWQPRQLGRLQPVALAAQQRLVVAGSLRGARG